MFNHSYIKKFRLQIAISGIMAFAGLCLPILTPSAKAEDGTGVYSDWIALQTSSLSLCNVRAEKFMQDLSFLRRLQPIKQGIVAGTDNDYGNHLVFICSDDGTQAMIASLGPMSMKNNNALQDSLNRVLEELRNDGSLVR